MALPAVTRNYKLNKPRFDASPWHDDVNENFDRIDSLLAAAGIPAITGGWKNSTEYSEGMRLFDVEDGSLWIALVDHISSSTGTFAEDRELDPSRWSLSVPSLIYRGEWVAGTNYVAGDFVYDNTEAVVAYALISHTATTSIRDDEDNWAFFVDIRPLVDEAKERSNHVGTQLVETISDFALNLLSYPSTTYVQTLYIPNGATGFSTRGYYEDGDLGGADFKTVAEDGSPLGPGQIQTNGGTKRWELAEFLPCVSQFGAKSDLETNAGPALQNAFDFCENKGLFWDRPYITDDGLTLPWNITILGAGGDKNLNESQPLQLVGAMLLARGTGQKNRYAYGITDDRASGGRIDNIADADFGEMDRYLSMASYYNEDADPITGAAATPKAFSAALTSKFGAGGITISNLRVIPNFNGVDGYNEGTLTLADDWDVGIYLDNARYTEMSNVQVLGYWRLNGLLVRSGALGFETSAAGVYSGGEENKFYNCVFEGWKSLGLRSIGMWRVMAVTSTYFEILWADNHPFSFTGTTRVTQGQFSPRSIPVTSIEKVGDRLRFYTETSQVSPLPVGSEIMPQYVGNGVAGTVFRDCRFHAMSHRSKRRISDPAIVGAMPPSACVEISGTRIRGPRFEGCKLQTVDDIAVHAHQCIDLMLTPNMRFEGTPPSANGGGGIRMISTDRTHPGNVGGTYRTQLHMEQGGADFTPLFGTVPSKFSTPGFWNPNVAGMIFKGGIYFGDADEPQTLFREYLVGGSTPTLSFEDNGDLVVNGVSGRTGIAERVGESINVYYTMTARMTFTTATGKLRMSLPTPAYEQTDIRFLLTASHSNLQMPANKPQLHGEIASGGTHITFFASGAGGRQELTTANVVSGSFITLVVAGSYRRAR